MQRRGPRIQSGPGGLDPAVFRGRLIDRTTLFTNVFQWIADAHQAEDPEEQQTLDAARLSLLAFTQLMMPRYVAEKFHTHVASYLDEVVARKIENLMIWAPPQHGKSVLVSQALPPFWLAHHTDLPVLLTSYGASRAFDNSRRARAFAMSPQFAKLFGGRTPDPANWRAWHWAFEGLPGYCFASGLGGPIAGMGFGLGIVDDPHESWEKAQSDTERQRAWEWWQGTYLTRLWEGAPTVFITTRWNEDDLAGRILAEEGRVEDGGKWTVLDYPAIAEAENKELGIPKDILGRKAGEPLAPRRFSIKWLEATRIRVGPMVWQAEYQQRPSRPEGDFFKIGRFDIQETVPSTICRLEKGVPVQILSGVRFWDLAATTKQRGKRDPDSTSGSLISEEPTSGRFWYLDRVSVQMDPEQVRDILWQTAQTDGRAVKIRIEQEPGASGKAVVDNYKKLLAGWDVDGVPHSGDKSAWATPWAIQVNAGNVTILKADWNKAVMAQHAGFPNAAHDDDVDSAAGAFNSVTLGRQFRDIPFLHA